MSTRTALASVAIATLATLATALAGCGSDDPSASPSEAASSSAESQDYAPTPIPVHRTPELDAIGAIGHSGATGYDSEGQPVDVPANSWITGTNPKVNSIYRRLLAEHPALKGHNWNDAMDGSSSTDLMRQAKALLTHDPVPDIVFIVSVDNDIRCDGTDEDNYDGYSARMDQVLTFLEQSAPGIKFFFNSQPGSVHSYAAVVSGMKGGAAAFPDAGPCDMVAEDGSVDSTGEAYLQQQVDTYYQLITQLCAERSDCATDENAFQAMTLEPKDLTKDFNHFTVTGLAKEAAIAWEELPPAWK